MDPNLYIVLNDGTKLEAYTGGPWSVREQIAWEEQFHQSFRAVYRAIGAEQRAVDAGDGEQIEATTFRVTWILWFAWYRLRPKVASKFSVFVDEQLDDYDYILDEPADDEPAEGGSLDPTGPVASSVPDPSPPL